jgi:hypothetical protein
MASARWARSLHAIAGGKVLKRPGQYTSSSKELGLRLTGNMGFGNADRTARDDVASGNILYTVDRD